MTKKFVGEDLVYSWMSNRCEWLLAIAKLSRWWMG